MSSIVVHLPGVVGSRDNDNRMEMSPDEPKGFTKESGFVINVANAFNEYNIDFQPPCRVR